MHKITLKVPSTVDLKYRKLWLSNSLTMAYNAGYEIEVKGYDKKTGTINLTDEELLAWYHKWVGHEPDRYYAYIYVSDIPEPIGEVYYYPEDNTHAMGILIHDKYRHQGYAYPSLLALMKVAFEDSNLDELIDMIPQSRVNAIKLFKKAGFKETNIIQNELIFGKPCPVNKLMMNKAMYQERNKE